MIACKHFLVFAVLMFCLAGCYMPTLEVCGEDIVARDTGYICERDYVLLDDVYVFKAGWNSQHRLLSVESASNQLPESLDAYMKSPGKWPWVKGVVRKGEIVRIVSYTLVSNPVAGVLVDVFAVIQTGPHQGLKVSLKSVSNTSTQSVRRKEMSPQFEWLVIDPAVLQLREN